LKIAEKISEIAEKKTQHFGIIIIEILNIFGELKFFEGENFIYFFFFFSKNKI
jgi:hypothetical protein